MLDVDQRDQKERPSSLAQWAYRAIGQSGVCLRVRLQGNNLHVLCESRQALDAEVVVTRFIKALKVQEGGDSLPIELGNAIYQIILYGRTIGQSRPDWIKQIRLKPPSTPDSKAAQTNTGMNIDALASDSELFISHKSLARSGSPEAIARYLSEHLSSLGVSVKVIIQELSRRTPSEQATVQEQETGRAGEFNSSSASLRLWVVCYSNYSPDPTVLAEPVVQQLRNLQLKGFQDAAICSQVSGEAAPEWMLRVDLTPPEEMLKEWACWGDVQAIARLLNQALVKQGMEVRAVLKDVTLHLFCSLVAKEATAAPDKQRAVSGIMPVLKAIAPQGIHAATIYGVEAHEQTLALEQETPAWIEWLNLPAADNQALAESTYTLAQRGSQDAITFLLQRLLNPDLDQRLATGGIHLKVRRKQDLLHIMSEAPICPPQAQIGPPIARFLRQLAIPGLAGVRVYGRRAGSTSPLWNYGIDFAHRRRRVPEATPEFAASDAYVNELVAPTGEAVLRRDLTKDDVKQGVEQAVGATVRTIGRWLCYSQLFVPTQENQDLSNALQRSGTHKFSPSQGVKVAMVWGTLGLLLTIQADWLIGRLVRDKAESLRVTVPEATPMPISLPQVSLRKGGTQDTGNFNASGFTTQGETSVIIDKETGNVRKSGKGAASAIGATGKAKLALGTSSNPSFNNPLLDEKLALYQQRLQQSGPPDVLIIGSSRALRGVDPIALQDALATQGYPKVEVFNFGINGATAQVVDLIIRRILKPEQLPKVIIWADGARAFNSGREDITYKAIAASEGYQQLKAGTFPNSVNAKRNRDTTQPLAFLNMSYQSINDWLNQHVGKISSTYPQRDQLKALLREEFVTLLKPAAQDQAITKPQSLSDEDSIDFYGFLPLSVRFNPATYYKQHPKVTGDYDSDYQSFQLNGKQDSALKALLQFTQARKISVVFVNLPLTKNYLDPVRKEYEEQFQRYMHASALEGGLIFRDLSQLLPTKHDYFSDPSHLNRYGANKVSVRLAQDPLIPWPNK